MLLKNDKAVLQSGLTPHKFPALCERNAELAYELIVRLLNTPFISEYVVAACRRVDYSLNSS